MSRVPQALNSWCSRLPAGELWCGREQFERCVGIIKYHKGSTAAEWKHLCYLVFDAPVIKGAANVPYENRNEFIEQVTKAAPYAAAVGISKCEGQAHLTQLLQAVCAHGAEGLMLRKPGSLYERVRSKSLLKVKTFLDAEAKVVGHTEGKNRLVGMLGALQLEMPCSGHTFEVRRRHVALSTIGSTAPAVMRGLAPP